MLQIQLLQIDRVRDWHEQFGREHDAGEEWKNDDRTRRCLMQFFIFIPGVEMETVVGEIEGDKDLTLFSCGHHNNGFSVVIEVDMADWQQVEKKLHLRLKPVEKNTVASAEPPILFVDPERLEVVVGIGLVHLMADVVPQLNRLIRTQLIQELGFIIPPIRVRDDSTLMANEYVIKVQEKEVARNKLFVDEFLVIGPPDDYTEGTLVNDPAFNDPARWITQNQIPRAEELNLCVVAPASVLTTHLQVVARVHAANLLRRQQVYGMIARMRDRYPDVTDAAVKKHGIPKIHAVLKSMLALLRPINDLERILEIMGDDDVSISRVDALTGHIVCSLFSEDPSDNLES